MRPGLISEPGRRFSLVKRGLFGRVEMPVFVDLVSWRGGIIRGVGEESREIRRRCLDCPAISNLAGFDNPLLERGAVCDKPKRFG